ncbi:hypothetical protein ASPZODRAFT_135533 [Penicilliopsis zonata CBS 506.65]|uniref:Uncharacterized protein n=1 Tax=Penicilliopsis zonata CBS 506.65 TaxID=1073090 RepID=A0A1L9SAE9_9EURO|nr:hypothetical protein ASPZODRAFT_135533 [Penicilliopsis zonata CBS 506.65]OJJ44079.1 hypothetical protein ASPZODRAFT_135533 [Penicilliopsis zonata CBS 506.65]
MAVGPRVSKEEFMRALGLDVRNPQHEQYYKAMRDEAIAVYNRLNNDVSSLIDSVRMDGNTRPPFFWHHVRADKQRWAILEVWRAADPSIRGLFDAGATEGEYGPNWVSGWLLYSVFRSRDTRNNRRKEKPGERKTYYDPVRNV